MAGSKTPAGHYRIRSHSIKRKLKTGSVRRYVVHHKFRALKRSPKRLSGSAAARKAMGATACRASGNVWRGRVRRVSKKTGNITYVEAQCIKKGVRKSGKSAKRLSGSAAARRAMGATACRASGNVWRGRVKRVSKKTGKISYVNAMCIKKGVRKSGKSAKRLSGSAAARRAMGATACRASGNVWRGRVKRTSKKTGKITYVEAMCIKKGVRKSK
jgi:hypothetical protein